MTTMTHTGPGRAILAAIAVTVLLAGYATPLAVVTGALAARYMLRRLRRWRPDPGMLAAGGLALVAGVIL